MRSTHSGYTRLSKVHKMSAAGLGAAGAAAVVFAVVSGGPAAAQPVAVKPVAFDATAFTSDEQGRGELARQADGAAEQARTEAAAKVKSVADAKAARAKADAKAAKDAKAKADRQAKERAGKEAASRSTDRKPLKAAEAPAAAPKAYGNDLDGWINQALDIMRAKGIPGSYEGIKRNIMRESTGNPQAVNDWDVNAVNGVPSKGLLQIIDPTFKAFHVDGTSWDIYDPVANIVASCNYAAKTYGSMDNVNSAY
ncbi:transglycosylase SLT domain-containing protein [Streptomyces caatingaensis]|uniref:Lytic transglycosylase n=1 Tax=Streptomyces caatingaensis TaxID=1678637 RepID=A0A0K9XBT3_9ACTN|nr:transglycosylase SLT domain-containing protein [Streptomyces caatingaensis]KNB50670.1 lytic transglycosylase [Streptomyces caatingaensis]KNB50875.1 lytic transglycosylase [Streptomyces caatingaensis]